MSGEQQGSPPSDASRGEDIDPFDDGSMYTYGTYRSHNLTADFEGDLTNASGLATNQSGASQPLFRMPSSSNSDDGTQTGDDVRDLSAMPNMSPSEKLPKWDTSPVSSHSGVRTLDEANYFLQPPAPHDYDDELDGRPSYQDDGAERRFYTNSMVGSGLGDAYDKRMYAHMSSNSDMTDSEWARRQNLSQLRRYGTRKVNLVKGRVFRAEYTVPTAVQMAILPEYRDAELGSTEFTHMRYTAATVDPDDFKIDKGYNLRAAEYGRETELLVCITYYNEDKVLTARTLYGVMQNIRDICQIKRSAMWQKGEAWKKIVVVIMMDGIEPCDKNVLDMMATIGVYQDGVIKRKINGEDTVAHIFEYTTELCVTPRQQLVRPESNNSASLPPIQMIMCLKQQNSKKINSHRWVFNAFCPILKPEIVCLIDAGTRPGPNSLLYLWQAFYNNKNVGGACGEIHAMLGPHNKALINPLVAAQNFEYKISNTLDKPLESVFGFISVLPGAFSAYRYRAVEGRPLEQYFHGDHTLSERLGKKGVEGMSIFRKNMFLAEDRILCFELCFKRNAKWHLTYVKASKAETDVPEGISELMGQRRRWLNGSFAAGIYALMHFGRIYKSSHNPLRLAALHLQFLYNILQQVLTWFNLGCYYLTITVIIELAANPKAYGSPDGTKAFPFGQEASSIISIICRNVYTLFLVISFILALGNRPKGGRILYNILVVAFGVVQIYALIIALYLAANAFKPGNISSFENFFSNFFTSTSALVVVALSSTFGLYIVSAILYLDPWHIIHSFLQYLFLQPSFVNLINVYAFSNWHDVSWGTKGSDHVGLLPTAKAVKEGNIAVVEEIARPIEDIDEQFQEVVERALAPFKPPREKNSLSVDDQNKMFRTWLLLVWIVSNVVLVWAITSTDSEQIGMTSSTRSRIAYFFAVLLWANAVVAIVRLVGCVIFLVTTFVKRISNRR